MCVAKLPNINLNEMKLLLDFGNSRLKYAVYTRDSKVTEGIIPTLTEKNLYEIPHFAELESIHLSSVIDIPPAIHALLSPKLMPNQTIIHGNDYDVSSLGEDRKLIALGAGPSHLSICLGTCITYNLVNEANEFIGGAISPGLTMRAAGMHAHTAHLPQVVPQHPYPTFGHNTQSNLIAGIMAGVEFEIKGFIQQAQKKVPNIQVVLTGGDAHHFSTLFNVDPDLIWKGMLKLNIC